MNPQNPNEDSIIGKIKKEGHYDPAYKAALANYAGDSPSKIYTEKQEAERKRLSEAINLLAETEQGIHFLRWLCDFLGFKDNVVRQSMTGDVLINAIIFNEARRNVWIDIRSFLNITNRNKVEEDIERGIKTCS
jgi:hypothetical protein